MQQSTRQQTSAQTRHRYWKIEPNLSLPDLLINPTIPPGDVVLGRVSLQFAEHGEPNSRWTAAIVRRPGLAEEDDQEANRG